LCVPTCRAGEQRPSHVRRRVTVRADTSTPSRWHAHATASTASTASTAESVAKYSSRAYASHWKTGASGAAENPSEYNSATHNLGPADNATKLMATTTLGPRTLGSQLEAADVPEGPGVYCWWEDDEPIYVAATDNLRRQLIDIELTGPQTPVPEFVGSRGGGCCKQDSFCLVSIDLFVSMLSTPSSRTAT